MHVFASALSARQRSGVTTGTRHFSVRLASGVVLEGLDARARVTLGPISTPAPIPIGVVTSLSCARNTPHCPEALLQGRLARGIAGVVGIGLARPGRGGAVNPVTQLPGVTSWSLHFQGTGGTLTLGARAETGATLLPLASEGRSGAAAFWSDDPRTCVTVGTSSANCVPTIFDTAAPDPVIYGGALATHPARRGSGFVPGLSMAFSGGANPPFWRFTTGGRSSSDQVMVAPGHGTVDASIAAFYADTVTYDTSAGSVALWPNLGLPLPPPAPLTPFVQTAPPGAGTWSAAGRPVNGMPAVYETSLVPPGGDAPAGIAWMDTHLLTAQLYSGSLSPGGGPYTYTAPVQAAQAASLVAAFNGGFLMKDAMGGYYSEGRTITPLVPGAASLVIYADGTVDVGAWGTDVTMTPDVVAVRQNLVPLVAGGQPTSLAAGGDWQAWGNTCGAVSCASSVPSVENQWRSAVGVTVDGALVYVTGPDLAPLQLAQLLVRAGVVRGMELDINPNWTVLVTYAPSSAGAAADPSNGSKLVPSTVQGPSTFFSASWARDFVAMSARPPVSG